MTVFQYQPHGVCSRMFKFEIKNNIIVNLQIEGGCAGNLLGISNIVKNKNISEVITAFQGVPCKEKGTSCPDQIAQALRTYLNH